MKKHLPLLLLLLVLKTGIGQTNVYHPFPDSNAVWKILNAGLNPGACSSNCSGGICVMDEDRQDSIGGDTIIQTIRYRKIYETNSQRTYYSGWVNCSSGYIPDTIYDFFPARYMGAIRQETNLRKVYIITPFSSPSEKILYDFNLKIGDTLPQTWINYSKSNYVSKIDSVLVGGSYHTRFEICDQICNYVSLIEGIGRTFGLLELLVQPFEQSSYLRCVKINSKPIFPDTTTICGTLFTGINNNNNLRLFSIYPNPSNDNFTIKTEIALKKCLVLDMLGNIVYSEENIHGISTTISLAQLSNGIYFLRVIGVNDRVYVQKLTIEH